MTITTTMISVLTEWRSRVRAVNEANGWFESGRTLDDGIALLHTEVAEAVEAYRRWGLEDATDRECVKPDHNPAAIVHGNHLCKPEGVGSEVADVLIRLLDETDRQDAPLDYFALAWPLVDEHTSFTAYTNALHRAIDRALLDPSGEKFGIVFAQLLATAVYADIDLAAEFERKIAYNATRGHRHGNKRL